MTRPLLCSLVVLSCLLSVQGAWSAILGTDMIYDSDYFQAEKVGQDLRIILTPREGLHLSFLSRLPEELTPPQTSGGIMLPGHKLWIDPKTCVVNNGIVEFVSVPDNPWQSPLYWSDLYIGNTGDMFINRGPQSITQCILLKNQCYQSRALGFSSMGEGNQDLKLAIYISLAEFDYIHSILRTPSLPKGVYGDGVYEPDNANSKSVLKHDPTFLLRQRANAIEMALAHRRQHPR